jgi:hypothetical protein
VAGKKKKLEHAGDTFVMGHTDRKKDESVKFKPNKDTLFASKKYTTKGKKEDGKVPFYETHAHKLEAGRHPLMALQENKGLVKNKTQRKLEKMTHKRKKKHLQD